MSLFYQYQITGLGILKIPLKSYYFPQLNPPFRFPSITFSKQIKCQLPTQILPQELSAARERSKLLRREFNTIRYLNPTYLSIIYCHTFSFWAHATKKSWSPCFSNLPYTFLLPYINPSEGPYHIILYASILSILQMPFPPGFLILGYT